MSTSVQAQAIRYRRFLLALLCAVAMCVTMGLIAGCDDEDEGESLDELVATGQAIQAERGSQTLDIVRTEPTGKKPSGIDKGSWTIFVYLCGSDLESEGGAATNDLAEMVSTSGGENVRYVVEAGGAKEWKGDVKSNRLQRFMIEETSIMEVDSVPIADMGNPETLSSFLAWGLKNYPAEHMGVILWDHGGGSITGVCFDERNDYDSLTLRELESALSNINGNLWSKFDFIGFDACLMGTVETANVLASYAKYMIASQETEPGDGWQYSAIMDFLAKNPGCDGAKLGKALCDTYYESLSKSDASTATLSLVDLSKVDDVIQDFYRFSQEMYASGDDQATLAAMSRGIRQAENYGGNNWLEGYTNMVDLNGLVNACAAVTPSASDVTSSIEGAVKYQVVGKHHSKSCGLSTYYPLKVQDANELSTFQQVALSPSYLSYVDRLAHGATYNGGEEYEDYSDDTWFEGGFWNWLLSDDEDDEGDEWDDYWDFLEGHNDESEVITFADEPQVDDEGVFWFCLDDEGIDNTSLVSGLLYALIGDGDDCYALGETCDIDCDWDSGEVFDGFDGKWLSLPDGQNLCLYIADVDDTSILYTSPISLNGEDLYLRMRQNIDNGKVTVEGAWDGIDECGAADRETVKIKKGDVIVPLYDAFDADDESVEATYEGEPYKVAQKTLKIEYDYLPAAVYSYSFCIEDVYGDTMTTDYVNLEVDEKGQTYFVD